MRSCLRIVLMSLTFTGWAVVASAGQDAKPPQNDDCLACHADPDLKRSDNTSLAVDARSLGESTHAPLACIDCHEDLASVSEFPHAERLAPAACSSCHDDAQTNYGAGIHAQARQAGRGLAATCADCHGTHDIRASSDPASRTTKLNLTATCAACHGNADVIAKGHIQAGNIVALYEDSIHGTALTESGMVVAPSCVDCHSSHEIRRKSEAGSSIHASTVPATCGKCHKGIEQQFSRGVHGGALAAGKADAPQCVTCHTAHSIRRADSEPWRLGVTEECGTCHAKVVDSFRRTFHGKVNQLGFGTAATCADCHSAHEVLPSAALRSTAPGATLVTTCGKCHEGANERFVQYDPHPDPNDYARSPLLWWANRLYTVLITGCFSFFAAHSGLWFFRSRRSRQARKSHDHS
jgi:nitrate/TMAO reductase-like tetraheme cytochrome c subunit